MEGAHKWRSGSAQSKESRRAVARSRESEDSYDDDGSLVGQRRVF